MGLYLNPNADAFQMGLNTEIYVDVTECLKTGVVRDFKLIVENTTQKVLVSFVDGAVTVVTK